MTDGFHFMTYQIHFMTDEIHFMTEPTCSRRRASLAAVCRSLLNEHSFSII
jgi:hypothetical protein